MKYLCDKCKVRPAETHCNTLPMQLTIVPHFRNKMDLDHLPWFATFRLCTINPSHRGDLVKIHLVAPFSV